MGIIVGVDVEGEDPPVLDERTDGKPLARIVADWITHRRVVEILGLSSRSMEALTQLDGSAYVSPGKKLSSRDVWQSPLQLRNALEELRVAVNKVRSTPTLLTEIESGPVWVNVNREMLEDGSYDIAIEDAIKTCEWAERHSRRVKLKVF